MKTILLILCLVLPASAQTDWAQDRKADKIYESAIESFKAQNYGKASKYFELVLERDPNMHTVTSEYMAGLCYYRLNDYSPAITHFQKLLLNYPRSPYEEDAQYHKSLLMLSHKDKRSGGLFVLMNLIQETKNSKLKKQAEVQLNNFFFYEAELPFLEEYYKIVRPSYKDLVTEAICIRLFKKQEMDKLADYLTEYADRNGTLSERLLKMGGNATIQESVIKIAVVLPFEMKVDTSLKKKAWWAFDLLAGILLATENEQLPYYTEVEIKVWDSNKSKEVTTELVNGDLKHWEPDVIIGEIYNSTSRILAEFAEENNILHLIPLSPSESLVRDKKNAFLVNPSISTQIKGLAGYIEKELVVPRILILKSEKTKLFYIEDFLAGLGEVEHKTVSTEEYDPEQFSRLVGSGAYSHVYMPMLEESRIHDYAQKLREDSRRVQLFGLPEWSIYNRLNKQLLSNFNTYITDAYAPFADTLTYNKVQSLFQFRYKNPPTIYVYQGYDIVRLAVNNLAKAIPYEKVSEAMSMAPPFKGINQTYYFDDKQVNQSVNILSFRDGNLVKVK